MDSDEDINVRRSKRRRSMRIRKRKSIDSSPPENKTPAKRSRKSTRTTPATQATARQPPSTASETSSRSGARRTQQYHRTFGNIQQETVTSSRKTNNGNAPRSPVTNRSQRVTSPLRSSEGVLADSPAQAVATVRRLDRAQSTRIRTAARTIQKSWRDSRTFLEASAVDQASSPVVDFEQPDPAVVEEVQTSDPQSDLNFDHQSADNSLEEAIDEADSNELLPSSSTNLNLTENPLREVNGTRIWARRLFLIILFLIMLVKSVFTGTSGNEGMHAKRAAKILEDAVHVEQQNFAEDSPASIARQKISTVESQLSQLSNESRWPKRQQEKPVPEQCSRDYGTDFRKGELQSCLLGTSTEPLAGVVRDAIDLLNAATLERERNEDIADRSSHLLNRLEELYEQGISFEKGIKTGLSTLRDSIDVSKRELKNQLENSLSSGLGIEATVESLQLELARVSDVLLKTKQFISELASLRTAVEAMNNQYVAGVSVEELLEKHAGIEHASRALLKTAPVDMSSALHTLAELQQFVKDRVYAALGDDSGIRDLSIIGAGAHVYFEDKLIPRDLPEPKRRFAVLDQLSSQAHFLVSSVWSATVSRLSAEVLDPTTASGGISHRVHRGRPDMIFTPTYPARNCWAMPGVQGNITVELPRRFQVSGFSVEHGFSELSPLHPRSVAPWHVQLFAVENGNCEGEAEGGGAGEGWMSLARVAGQMVTGGDASVKRNCAEERLLGELWYGNTTDGARVQHAAVREEGFAKKDVRVVKFVVLSNHGHDGYTCLHRLRVW